MHVNPSFYKACKKKKEKKIFYNEKSKNEDRTQ